MSFKNILCHSTMKPGLFSPYPPPLLLTYYGWDHRKAISSKTFLQHSLGNHQILYCNLQINSMNKEKVLWYLFQILPVNGKYTSNSIIQITSREEHRQQFSFQPSRTRARSEDRFLSRRGMSSERQRLILELKSKANEIITLVHVREQWEARDLGGSQSETWCCCQQDHSLGTNKENT